MNQKEAGRIFCYNPETGIITWAIRPTSNVLPGTVAGSLGSTGYMFVRYKKKRYQAHVIAWTIVNGFPKGDIDHINGDKTDNRLLNLRDVSHRTNCTNRLCHREGKLVGASYDKSRDKWISLIRINGRIKNLGRYGTEQEAHAAYLQAYSKVLS